MAVARRVPMDLSKYRALFVSESREHLDGISSSLLTIERNPSDRAALDNLFRHAHSIKGMAASMGYDALAMLAHKLEDLADLARRGVPFDQETVELWLSGADWLVEMVGRVEAGREGEITPAPMMDKVLQKAVAMMALVPAAANTKQPLTVGAHPAAVPPAPPGTASSSEGLTTEPRLAAIPGPPLSSPTSGAATGVRSTVPSTTLALPAIVPVGGGAASPAREGTAATMAFAAVAPRDWDVKVVIGEQSATPHVRAFLVHKRVSEKLEIVEMTPPLPDLRRGVLPDRTLQLRVRGAIDEATLDGMIRGIPDVAQVSVAVAGPARVAVAQAPKVAPTDAAAAARTVRVRTELLDELIDSVGEILLARARLRSVATRLDDPVLGDLADEFTRLAQGLHDRVLSARMTPVSVLTDRLPRVVRDLARKRDRDVEFNIEGANIELDRAVLDELHDPLLHLVRNAVDHAHEGGPERGGLGKPAAMSLIVTASRDRDHVLIALSDDGKGMDPARIRQSAIEKGILTAEAAVTLNDQASLELICKPGFSTAAEISDTSGRGVGMDVVRAKVEQLGGQLLIESTPGRGTTFTLRLPLTVAIIRVLLVSAAEGDAVYALPLARVDHAIDYAAGKVVISQGTRMYPVSDGLAPLHDLGRMLGYDVRPERAGGTVVVIERPFRPMAVRVERIMGQQEVVVKPLGEPLAQVPFLAGGALLADGRPAYILDVGKLVDGSGAAVAAQEAQ